MSLRWKSDVLPVIIFGYVVLTILRAPVSSQRVGLLSSLALGLAAYCFLMVGYTTNLTKPNSTWCRGIGICLALLAILMAIASFVILAR
jgi:hypothetical protein